MRDEPRSPAASRGPRKGSLRDPFPKTGVRRLPSAERCPSGTGRAAAWRHLTRRPGRSRPGPAAARPRRVVTGGAGRRVRGAER